MRAFRRHTDLTPEAETEEDSTDAYRFFQAGYPAVTIIEEVDEEGWPVNPYYHESSDYYLGADHLPQQCDGRDYIDTAYMQQVVRGVVAWAGSQAGFLGAR